MEIKKYKIKAPIFKITINKTFLFVLGKAAVFLSKHDFKIRKKIEKLNIDFIKLSILGMKESLIFKRRGNSLKKTKVLNDNSLKIEIIFKNIDSAFLLLTGQLGPEQGFWEHRIFLKGNISNALIFTEVLKRVEEILFPGFFHKKLFKTKPELGLKDYLLRTALYLLTPVWLIEFLIRGN